MTSKHGDFFAPLGLAYSGEASPLSVFLTGCKGKFCPAAFGLDRVTRVTPAKSYALY
jgi:hypothetical protein